MENARTSPLELLALNSDGFAMLQHSAALLAGAHMFM